MGMISVAGMAIILSFGDIEGNSSLHVLVIGVAGVIFTVMFSGVTALTALIKGRRMGYFLWGGLLLLSVAFSVLLLYGYAFTPIEHMAGSVAPEILLRSRIVVAIAIALIIAFLSIIIVPSCQDGRSLHSFVVRLPLGKFFMNFISNFLMYKDDLRSIILAYVLSFVLQLLNFFCYLLLE